MSKIGHGPSLVSLHGMQQPPLLPQMPPTLCNPCSNTNNFNSVPLPGPSRWGPRTSCPVHSPFRVRVPNGNACSGHQVRNDDERMCVRGHKENKFRNSLKKKIRKNN